MDIGVGRQIDVQSGPKTDQPKPLASPQAIAGLNGADDSTGHQSGDLNKGNLLSRRAFQL
jgi:hypothetical protein